MIDRFSPHLFWDTDKDALNLDKHKAYIVKQVLEYGLIGDWEMIREYYGIPTIAKVAAGLRELDPRALTYIATISKKPLTSFRCYTTPASRNPLWNF